MTQKSRSELTKRRKVDKSNKDDYAEPEEGTGEVSTPQNFQCDKCEKVFEDKRQLGGHYADHHSAQATVTLNNGAVFSIPRDATGEFSCILCRKHVKTTSSISRHVKKCIKHLQDNKDAESTTAQEPQEPSSWKPFSEALMSACGKMNTLPSEVDKTLFLADLFKYFPVGISVEGKEVNVLARQEVIDSVPSDFTARIHVSKVDETLPPKWEAKPCKTCAPLVPPAIQDIIKGKEFAPIISSRTFLELTEKGCDLLNLDWSLHSEAPQVAGELLSGGILLDAKTGKAILMNEVEVYGRMRSKDCHRESSGSLKGVTRTTSTPGLPGEDYYPNVRPITLPWQEGKRVIIGTQTCDILITSCLRLDVHPSEIDAKTMISVGGCTQNFDISMGDDMRIFIDECSRKNAETMVGQPQDMIVKNMGLHSLRQLRSKFHNLTTYTRSRFSGPLTAAFKVRPFTVFTVESFGNDWGATHANAILLQKIAEAVLLNGPSAVLSRDDVSEALSMAKNTKLAVKQQKTLEDIMRLFDNNETDIKIIGNRELNDSLEIIADCLSGRITEANVQVNLELQTLFRLRIAA